MVSFAAKEFVLSGCITCAAAKMKQLHLARLASARNHGYRFREVSKKHPFRRFKLRALRDHLNQQINLADPNSGKCKNSSQRSEYSTSTWRIYSAALQFPNHPQWRKSCLCICGSCSHNPGQIGTIRA